MEAIDTTSLYRLGLKMQLLSNLQAGQTVGEVGQYIEEPATHLLEFADNPKFQLTICLPAAKKLLQSLSPYATVEWLFGTDTRTGEDAEFQGIVLGGSKIKITERKIREIRSCYRDFEAVLFAELRKKHIYIFPPVRAFSIDVLMNDASKAFDPELLSFIPKNCIMDIQEAGKCLVTNIPNGVSFHLFRAIEGQLRSYGTTLGIINQDLKDEARNWGNYLNLAKGKGAKEGIVSFLRQIKDSYRNPLVHSDAQLTSKQAPGFFSLATGTIELIADLAKEESSKKPNK